MTRARFSRKRLPAARYSTTDAGLEDGDPAVFRGPLLSDPYATDAGGDIRGGAHPVTLTKVELERMGYALGADGVARRVVSPTKRESESALAIATRERVPTEHEEQVSLVKWARLNVGSYPDLAMLAAVPNGGHRHKATAGKLKAEGVRAGYPDLLLDVARGPYFGWRGEMKRRRGRHTSPAQLHWHRVLRTNGYRVDVAFGWEEMRDALLQYLALPLSPRLP